MIEAIEWATTMVERAEELELYESTCTNTGGLEPRRTQACMRCVECGCVVFPPTTDGKLIHLSGAHGWRMDGTRDPDAARDYNPNIVKGMD